MSWQRLLIDAKLQNEHVLLRPMSRKDREPLRKIAFDPEIWRYFVTRVDTEADFEKYLAEAVADTAAGRRAVFCVISKVDQCIAGATCYGNMAEAERRLEIGWSWLGAPYRGTEVNRNAKYLLLEYAFETLQCERVEFKTDVINIRARKGLEGIGAIQEGIFRSYNYMPDDRRRDAVFYSIIKKDWPGVRESLKARLVCS